MRPGEALEAPSRSELCPLNFSDKREETPPRVESLQFPGQAAVTKGFCSGAGAGEAGGAKALRFCSGFVDDGWMPFS